MLRSRFYILFFLLAVSQHVYPQHPAGQPDSLAKKINRLNEKIAGYEKKLAGSKEIVLQKADSLFKEFTAYPQPKINTLKKDTLIKKLDAVEKKLQEYKNQVAASANKVNSKGDSLLQQLTAYPQQALTAAKNQKDSLLKRVVQLEEKAVVEESSVTASDGNRYLAKRYNLDAIIYI